MIAPPIGFLDVPDPWRAVASHLTSPRTTTRRRVVPDALARTPITPFWTHTLSLRLYLAAVFLIPIQIENDAFRRLIETRVSPGDLLLALSIVMAPLSLRLIRQPVGFLPIGLLLTLCYGLVIALVIAGGATDHAVKVKFLGALVLVALGSTTLAYAQAGYAPRILRVFLQGAMFSAIIGFIDFEYLDVLPLIDHDNPERFDGLVNDPNNAGALFAVAMLLSARYGRHIFAARATPVLLTIGFAFATTQTLSRGAFIAIVVAIAAMVTVDRVSAERAVRWILAGLVVAGVVLASGFAERAIDDFSNRPDNVGGRNTLASQAIDLWVESGGPGAGLGSLRAEVGEIVHNTGLWLVTEMSLPGLLYLLAVLVLPIAACLRLRAHDRDLAVALLGAHVLMAVASVGIEALYQRGWWVVIGCTALPIAARYVTEIRPDEH